MLGVVQLEATYSSRFIMFLTALKKSTALIETLQLASCFTPRLSLQV
jgi:hypothetical protein